MNGGIDILVIVIIGFIYAIFFYLLTEYFIKRR